MQQGWADAWAAPAFPELLPPELAAEGEDDTMSKRSSKTRVLCQFLVHHPDGTTDGPIVVSDEIPTEDYDLGRAFAHLAARAAERLPVKSKKHRHD